VNETSPRSLATRLVERLRSAGHEALFAGGCVRDLLLAQEPKDFDVVTSATPEQVQHLFRRTRAVGKAFGVILVFSGDQEFEVATFRSDGAYGDGRHPDSVTFGTIEEDAARRDLTINGLYFDPLEERVIDLVGGLDDLRAKVVRAIGDPGARFREDSLRLLRVVRFCARLDFRLEDRTAEAVRRDAPLLARVSAERILDELTRILTGPNAGRGLTLLEDLGLLSEVLPELARLRAVEQPRHWHPEGDVLTHTLRMVSMLHQPSPVLAWAVLLHDCGKALTSTGGPVPHFPGHAEVGADLARTILLRLKASNHLVEGAAELVELHDRFMQVREMRRSTLLRLLGRPCINELLELHRLDCASSERSLETWQYCKEILASLPLERLRPAPLLDGHGLGGGGEEAR